MLKKLLVILAMLFASVGAFAAVDVNKATAAELDAVKGIGPATSKNIIDERKKGPFKDWNDLITRVKGVGETNAAKFSAEGLTVGGATFSKADAKKETKAEKKADKQEAKEAKKDEKAGKKAEKAEMKAEKKEEKKEAAAKPASAASKPATAASRPASAAKK